MGGGGGGGGGGFEVLGSDVVECWLFVGAAGEVEDGLEDGCCGVDECWFLCCAVDVCACCADGGEEGASWLCGCECDEIVVGCATLDVEWLWFCEVDSGRCVGVG